KRPCAAERTGEAAGGGLEAGHYAHPVVLAGTSGCPARSRRIARCGHSGRPCGAGGRRTRKKYDWSSRSVQTAQAVKTVPLAPLAVSREVQDVAPHAWAGCYS